MTERSSAARMYEQQQEMKLSAQREGAIFTTEATTEKPVWAPSVRKLYRAAMYWGFGKRAAWTLATAAHKRMGDHLHDADAWYYVAYDDLAGVTRPLVNGADLVLAACAQVPALLELGEIDLAILQCEDIQQNALQILGLLEELHSYGLRRKRTVDGWQFYIKGAHDAH